MQFMDEMIEVKKGLRQVEYEHPLLEQVSGETYGVMIYQEQVQAAAKLLAGYYLAGADLLRRAMGKRTRRRWPGKRPTLWKDAGRQTRLMKKRLQLSLTRLKKIRRVRF